MKAFQYVSASDPNEAISLIGQNGRYLAGGIDLLGEMKEYIVSPDILVDVKNAGFVGPIIFTAGNPGAWVFAPTATIAEIAANEQLKKDVPGLVEAASEVGSPQIRNVATLGGNLLQHSRCWYYRQPDITCLKRGGSTCYGQEGENKYLSLYSGCACVSPIVSNLSVILTALDAAFDKNDHGAASVPIPIADLYAEAWKNPTAHNSFQPRDFLLSVGFRLTRTRSAYRQISEKREFDWAMVSCAAAGNVTNGNLTDARVVLGAVAPVPYMVEAANKFLEGKPLTDETASKAADIILKDAKPLANNGYKVPLAHTLIRRTLLALNP